MIIFQKDLMNKFIVKPTVSIPYFDHKGSFVKTIRNSAKRRSMNPIIYLLKKILNLFLFRISFFCPLNSIRVKCHRLRGVNIGKNVYIGMHCTIDNAYPEYIYIEDNVSLAGDCFVIAHSNPYSHFQNVTSAKVASVVIKQGAWICIRAVILPGVIVGANAIVSAGTIVDSEVPSCSVISGNPAKIIARNLPIN
jgi:acetyltransferase-like isoleucine patch superfamily enzyme